MNRTMNATIKHETKKTYRVSYTTSEGWSGCCFARGISLEDAKINFAKHYRAKGYQLIWGE